ncbi:MAG: protein phosphatase 2C domain-containing protein [Salinibacter sp.]
MPPRTVVHRILSVPRAGSDAASEDAAAVRAEDWPVRAAVADGATESAFSGLWARTLVDHLLDRSATTAEAFAAAVDAGQAEWTAAVTDRLDDRPWYVRAKAEEGAFATVLGVVLSDDGAWTAVAVGDCCLFHLRDGGLVGAWPYDDPDAFTHRPSLVPSRRNRPVPVPKTTSGTWETGDQVLLATDAVAAWLLRRGPASLRDADVPALRRAVQAAREEGRLRNDDATLLVLTIDDRARP